MLPPGAELEEITIGNAVTGNREPQASRVMGTGMGKGRGAPRETDTKGRGGRTRPRCGAPGPSGPGDNGRGRIGPHRGASRPRHASLETGIGKEQPAPTVTETRRPGTPRRTAELPDPRAGSDGTGRP